MEIERKFLLPSLPPDLDRYPGKLIEQGYLAFSPEGVEIRVRRKGNEHFLTVKKGGGLSRLEVELPVPAPDFETLWPLTTHCRVRKTRHNLPGPDGLTIELDVYGEKLAGLWVAEVEFPDEDAARAFQPPAHFGREITDDPAYRNQTLARKGLPRV